MFYSVICSPHKFILILQTASHYNDEKNPIQYCLSTRLLSSLSCLSNVMLPGQRVWANQSMSSTNMAHSTWPEDTSQSGTVSFKLACVKFQKCHESCLFPAVMHNVIRHLQGFHKNWCFSETDVCKCLCVFVYIPGPHTVDLMPVCSRTGTLLIAPSICCMNTSQYRSNRLKANLSDTWKIKHTQMQDSIIFYRATKV